MFPLFVSTALEKQSEHRLDRVTNLDAEYQKPEEEKKLQREEENESEDFWASTFLSNTGIEITGLRTECGPDS